MGNGPPIPLKTSNTMESFPELFMKPLLWKGLRWNIPSHIGQERLKTQNRIMMMERSPCFVQQKREKFFYFSGPVLDSRFVFFHLKSYDFDWKAISDLKGLEIGGTNKYNYGEAFQNAEKAGDLWVDRVPSDEMNFEKLLNGRIQIFPMDILVGYYMLNQLFAPEVVSQVSHHPTPVRTDPMHLLLNTKNPANQQRIVRFNKGLNRFERKWPIGSIPSRNYKIEKGFFMKHRYENGSWSVERKSMKKPLLCLYGIITIFLSWINSSPAQETIRLSNGEWEPFLSQNYEHYGVLSRIVTETFALEGITVEYGFFPWKRAMALAQDGDWDGSIIWGYNQNRAKHFIYSDPVSERDWGVFSFERDDIRLEHIGGFAAL